jgi:MFS family permease
MTVGLFGLALGFEISILDPFIYNEKIRLLAPAGLRNTLLGLVTIISLGVALVTQPLIGRWSDRTNSRWGRRLPYLAIGSIGVSLALILIVTSQTLWLLVIAAMLVSGFSNTTQAAWQAFIPDLVAERQRGMAAGIKTILELIGAVLGVSLAGFLLAQGNMGGLALLSMALFFIVLAITFSALRQTIPLITEGEAAGQPLISSLVANLRGAPPSFLWWMVNRFLFWSSAISIRTFMLNYLEDVLGLSATEAQALGSRLFIMLGLGVLILALPAGAVADRVGRRPLLISAGLMATGGVTLFMIWQDITMLFVGGVLIAGGAGIYVSASWALATDLAPKAEGALYLALANGATVLGSMGGRLGGPLIDALNQVMRTVDLGYLVVFGIAALFFTASSAVVLKIEEGHKNLPSQ